ncbi:TPA: hypothetical protein ACX6RO_001817 [Photobacterium damselae]
MVVDIPDDIDFKNAGKAQFDFAWDIVMSFLTQFDEFATYVVADDETEQEYWEAAKQRVLTALAIVQQGVELIIKGKIANVSPYLLIAGSPSDWPKKPQISFSELRTIDAQDLVKVFNTFSDSPLSDEFIAQYNELRKLRNRVMHTVDHSLKVTVIEVVTTLLEMHRHLFPDESWVTTRRDFLHESPGAHIFSSDDANGRIAWEFFIVFSILKRAEVKKFFGIDKKQRLYTCPECYYECQKYTTIEPVYAVLSPNEPESEHLYCFVCDDLHPIERKDCISEECKGNVISIETGECCSCGESYC